MAKEQLAVIEMITNMILGKTDGVSKVDFTPQKIPFPESLPYEQAFLRAKPESQGVSSEKLIHLQVTYLHLHTRICITFLYCDMEM